MKNKNIVILVGANGFIGSHIAKSLTEHSIKFDVIGRKNCNLLNLNQVKFFLDHYKGKGLDIIFTSSIVRRKEDTISARKKNILMVKNFIESSIDHVINSFIYLSSIDVYENNGLLLDESSKLFPSNPYSGSKIDSENILQKAFEDNFLTILRMPGIYGLGDNFNSIIGNFIKSIKEDMPLNITNNGEQLRDYLYIDDVSRCVLNIITTPTKGLYNLSSGNSLKLISIIELISKKLNKEIIVQPSSKDSLQKDLKISNSKFLNRFPNFSFTSMELGIERYLDRLDL